VWGCPSNGLLFVLNLANIGQFVNNIKRGVIHTKSIANSKGLFHSYLGGKVV